MAAHRGLEPLAQLLTPRLEPGAVSVAPVGPEWQTPVAPLLEPLARRPGEGAARLELSHPAEEGLGARDEAGGEELGQHCLVELWAEAPGNQDGLDLRREEQLPVRDGIVERLDPETVPRQEQPLALAVPEREGEHPLQPLHAALAFLLVEMEDRLRIALGAVAMAARHEPRPQARGIVDLAVVGEPAGAVLIGHGLLARGHVHDGQPAMAEPYRPLGPYSLAVGPAVADDIAH